MNSGEERSLAEGTASSKALGRACLEAERQAGARCVSDIRDCYERRAESNDFDQSNDFEFKRH